MTRCQCCREKWIKGGEEMCAECVTAIQDARDNPSQAHYPQTGPVISGYSDSEIEAKKTALAIIKSKVTGRDDMSAAVFTAMCECVGVQFCYECGTTDRQQDAEKVVSMSEMIQKLGLGLTSGNYPVGGSAHFPIAVH